MDAVFFPRAVNDPLVLAQEGWHYEIEKKDDPLTFKGGDLRGNIKVSQLEEETLYTYFETVRIKIY